MLDTATVRDDFAAWSGDEAYRQFDEWLSGELAKAYDLALERAAVYYNEAVMGDAKTLELEYQIHTYNPYRSAK